MFMKIPDAHVIVHKKGVYKQCSVYARVMEDGAYIYAGWGSGFIRLSKGGGTSDYNARWQELYGVDVVNCSLNLRYLGEKLHALNTDLTPLVLPDIPSLKPVGGPNNVRTIEQRRGSKDGATVPDPED